MASSFLQRLVDPKKNFLARLHMKSVSNRLRRYGLRYDDLYDPMYDLDIKEALNRLPREVVDARNQRLKRALDLSMKHEYLPDDLQAVQTPFRSYLQEMLALALSGCLHLQLSPSSPKLRRPNPSLSTRPNPSLSSLSSSLSISLTGACYCLLFSETVNGFVLTGIQENAFVKSLSVFFVVKGNNFVTESSSFKASRKVGKRKAPPGEKYQDFDLSMCQSCSKVTGWFILLVVLDAVDVLLSSAPSRSTAARALVDTAVRSWRIKYPTSKNDDCTVVCLFLQDVMEDAHKEESVSISNKEEEEENAIVQVKEESISKSCGIESKMMTTMTLAECISVAQDDEEWSALEGLTRVNSLLSIPRLFSGELRSTSWRKWL
ncbi:hypothetical protein Bca101_063750 [Brassica carinata]